MTTFFSGGFLYNPKTKEVLLHKRDGNTNINPNKWAFFGGSSEGGETPSETFVREIQEEIGVKLSNSEAIPLCDYYNEDRGVYRYSFYAISDVKKEEMTLGEGADFDWISLDKISELDATQKTFDDLKIFLKNMKI